MRILLNLLWIIFGGLISFLGWIGIPWGKQFFKIAMVALMPFGAVVTHEHVL